ncbi:Phospholipase/carboxylesterase/thioesterase [Phycomyces nitens]|nr:Phospholipase/carboxylesterase/thioesterase [Phycomyces nitens]
MSGSIPVVFQPTTNHTATVVWLHGLGDNGDGWSFLAKQLSGLFPYVKWILPNAPLASVTLNRGSVMRAWFDVISTDPKKSMNEDCKGIDESFATINQIIKDEIERGIPSNRIVLGGFSQGCALSLFTGLTTEYKLAAIIGCSGRIPRANKILPAMTEANKTTPILMCHGDDDPVVSFEYGQECAARLKMWGYDVEFKPYPDLGHSASPQEVLDISSFLEKNIPPV